MNLSPTEQFVVIATTAALMLFGFKYVVAFALYFLGVHYA